MTLEPLQSNGYPRARIRIQREPMQLDEALNFFHCEFWCNY